MVTVGRFTRRKQVVRRRRPLMKKNKNLPSKKMVSMVKNIVKHTALEKKRHTQFGIGLSVANVLHRDFYYTTPLTAIVVGTGDPNRTGSEVYVNSMQIKIMINRKSTFYDDIKIRLWGFWQPKNETDWAELSSIGSWTSSATLRPQFLENESYGLEAVNNAEYGFATKFSKQIILKGNNYGSVTSSTTKSANCYTVNVPCNFPFKFRAPAASQTVPLRQFFLAFYAYGGGLIPADLNSLFDLSCSIVTNFRDV